MRTITSGALTALALSLAAAGCSTMGSGMQADRPETVYGVTASNMLVRFPAGRPATVTARMPITGLAPGETLLGIDFRPANGRLYALGTASRLYTIDTATGAATPVGQPMALALSTSEVGFDFNPVVDRIRVVTPSGQNLRLHPDTGAVVDPDANMAGLQTDGTLTYAMGDAMAGKASRVAGAAYTNGAGTKTTTNFAIDAANGTLVTQGSREGVMPAVSPNSGQLFTVGSLGIPMKGQVGFDIAITTGAGFVAVAEDAARSTFYSVDLAKGTARRIGMVPEGLKAIAVAP